VYVKLKEGMRVVLQANLEPTMGLVNGSQGVITSFEPFDDKRLPRKAETHRLPEERMLGTLKSRLKFSARQTNANRGLSSNSTTA
jgi:hypothetical protein